MKTLANKIILFVAVFALIACDHSEFPSGPVVNTKGYDTVDCSGMSIPAGSITVRQALNIGKTVPYGGVSKDYYYIKGLVTEFDNSLDKNNKKKHESGMLDFGNGVFYIQDNTDYEAKFYCYRTKGINGTGFTSLPQLKIGDFVVVKCKINNYNGTMETDYNTGSCLLFSTNKLAYGEEETTDTIDTSGFKDFPAGTITVKKAREIGMALSSGSSTTQEYLIKGRVKKLNESKNADAIPKYGNIYFYIHDSEKATTDFYGYQVMGMNGKWIKSADQVQVGDFVVIKSKIKNYNGTIETVDRGSAQLVYSTNPKAYE